MKVEDAITILKELHEGLYKKGTVTATGEYCHQLAKGIQLIEENNEKCRADRKKTGN